MTPEIVLGPPGTGKTTTLLNLVDQELAVGTPADRIAYVSFTRQAAEEAVTRAVTKFGLKRSDMPYFRTLHSLCYRQLGLRSSDVLEHDKMREFASYARVSITGRFSEDGTLTGYQMGDRIMHLIHLSKVKQVDLRHQYDVDNDSLPWATVDRVNRQYQMFKDQHGLTDYNDMLEQFLRQGAVVDIDVLLVDEAQDLSELQWKVVDKLASRVRRMIVAGDDDQAIYRWAGASVAHLIDLPGTTSVLNQSYRVPPAVQQVANQLVPHFGRRRDKVWRPRPGEEGEVRRVAEFGLAVDQMGEGSVLVLARNTYLLEDRVEPELRSAGIVYERHGNSSISPRLLQAIVTWEDLRAGKMVRLAEARQVFEYMSVGQGFQRGHKLLPSLGDDPDVPVSMDVLRQQGGLLRNDIWHEALDRIPAARRQYIIAARRRGERLRTQPRVRLSTIHAAKGGEADHVVLLREMAPRSYREMELSPEDEARVWYVAVTRARRQLTIVDPGARSSLACPWL